MRLPKLSPQAHWILLILFALGAFCLIYLPVLLMGYSYSMPDTIKSTRILVETGQIVDTSTHMMLVILTLFHPFIAWENVSGWIAVSVAMFSLSLLPLWWSIRMLFNETVAWFSTIIFTMLPLSWIVALSLGGYCFALFPLFLSFGLFIKFHEKKPLLAIMLSGLFCGMALANQHSYLAFLPWLAAMYLWHGRQHLLTSIKRTALFCATAYVMFLLPMVPHAFQQDLSAGERVKEIFSPMEQATPGEGHLYPDEFLFENYREEYNVEMRERIAESSFIKRQEDRNYRIIFGAGDFSFFDRISTGTWMLVNSLPDFFIMDFVGGAFLWLFILPGILIALRTRKEIVIAIAGLILSMEFLLRYVLLFTSSHLDNYMWALALLGGIGAAGIITALSKSWKLSPKKQTLLAVFVLCIISMQMLQANRKQLARMYARSNVLEVYSATEELKKIPDDSVIAGPRRDDLLRLSDKKYVSVHSKTIEFLLKRGKLAEPFKLHNVTHIIGYSKEEEQLIRNVMPRIEVIEFLDGATKPEISAFIRYLLHTIR